MAKLEDIIAKLRRVIEERETALAGLRKVLENFEALEKSLPPDAKVQFEKSVFEDGLIERAIEDAIEKQPPQRGEISPREVAEAARDVLAAENRPMRRGEIVIALEKKGVPVPGRDKNKNLGTILWRHPELFVSLKELGYWLKERPLPGVYEPEE